MSDVLDKQKRRTRTWRARQSERITDALVASGFVVTGGQVDEHGSAEIFVSVMEPDIAVHRFWNGDTVRKSSGDYTFDGTIVATFRKRGGALRYVVEDARGLLLIMSPHQLEKCEDRA